VAHDSPIDTSDTCLLSVITIRSPSDGQSPNSNGSLPQGPVNTWTGQLHRGGCASGTWRGCPIDPQVAAAGSDPSPMVIPVGHIHSALPTRWQRTGSEVGRLQIIPLRSSESIRSRIMPRKVNPDTFREASQCRRVSGQTMPPGRIHRVLAAPVDSSYRIVAHHHNPSSGSWDRWGYPTFRSSTAGSFHSGRYPTLTLLIHSTHTSSPEVPRIP
jgi:hypothetical protein